MSDELRCPNCGQPVPEGTAFCPHCGAGLGSNYPQYRERKRSGELGLLLVISIIFAMMGGCGLFFAATSRGNDELGIGSFGLMWGLFFSALAIIGFFSWRRRRLR